MNDLQLGWVQRNRGPRTKAHLAEECLKRLVRGMDRPENPRERRILSVIGETTDEDFRRHCRVEVKRAMVTIHVDDASLVGVMRLKWSARLQEALRGPFGDHGALRCRFAYGTAGRRISGDTARDSS